MLAAEEPFLVANLFDLPAFGGIYVPGHVALDPGTFRKFQTWAGTLSHSVAASGHGAFCRAGFIAREARLGFLCGAFARIGCRLSKKLKRRQQAKGAGGGDRVENELCMHVL
jgi:hypothetical protein